MLSIDLGNGAIEVSGGAVPGDAAAGARPKRSGVLWDLLVRPEWTSDSGPYVGTIGAHWFRGPHTDYLVGSPAGDILLRRAGPPRSAVGEQLRWGLSRVWVLGPSSDRSQQNHQQWQADQPDRARPNQPSAAAMPR
jgi:hypothetical protein